MPRPHTRLFQQCLQGYDVLPWPARDTRSFANRACLDALGSQLQPSRDTGEINLRRCKDYGRIFHIGVSVSDLIESMPRRISACIAARGGFTTY
ncbi:uncharacterized protein TNCV_2277361 [Trichonephila clavipes]|nr:uncharacterized protein TNCV_2277361 [Trichonephila clavipes]